ncbi:hypothetical protein C2G38_2234843 [Gigaspora rosea]|uniref:Uncharacterized protein n=1 Tax=Gigaspora rosea TaxID=44941 RepID=A0A397TV98_9GLOM|nr:hypothetical protein C2G38_2234843 [Gigaspora rosea]
MGKIIDILSSEDSLMNEDASRSLIKRNTYVNDSDAWSKDFFKHPNSWDIVDRYEMIPITTLLEKEMQEQIKSIEANKHIIDCEIPIFRLKKRSYMMPYLKFANTFGKNNRTDNKERRKSIHKPFKILESLTKESVYYLESDNSEFFECIIKDVQKEQNCPEINKNDNDEARIGTKKDENKAYRQYKKSADAGNSNGMNSLGYCF